MKVFSWCGHNVAGKQLQGEITASSENFAKFQLSKQKINVTFIKKQSLWRQIKTKFTKQDFNQQHLLHFFRRLSTLIKAGLPLNQCMTSLINWESNIVCKNIFLNIKNNIESGNKLSTALALSSKYFNS